MEISCTRATNNGLIDGSPRVLWRKRPAANAVRRVPGSRLKLPRTKGVFLRPFKALRENLCSAPCLHGEGVDQIHRAALERV